MNREIKFRGKRLTDGQWIYGDFFRNRGLAFIAGDGIVENPLASWQDYNVDPDTVGQFTGLHDAQGKEIYEGDIFQVKAYEPKYEVYFANGVYEYRQIGSPNRPFPLRRINFDSYVIGNVYDNPELLKGGNQ